MRSNENTSGPPTQKSQEDGQQSTEVPSSPRKNLENLPESTDKEFWGDAEIHTNLIPHSEFSEKGHYFELVAGRTAECRNCHWGFELDRGDKIENGHLFDRSGKLVI